MRITSNFEKHDFEEKISKKHDSEFKIFSKNHDFELKSFCEKHDFELNVFHLVRFEINSFTMRQILSALLLQFAKNSCVCHKRPRFRNVLRYGVGSISQVIPLR